MKIDKWKTYRASRVEKPTWVQVMLFDIEVDIMSNSLVQVQVHFAQNYSASNYQEVSAKTMSLEAVDGNWKILTEANANWIYSA